MILSEVLWGFFLVGGKEDASSQDSRGSKRGQGNFELATNCDYIHLGQLTQEKVSVSVGFQSLP